MEIENNLKTYYEHQINNIDIDIDVERAVMSRITTHSSRTYNKNILAFLVIISMCMASTGIVYGQEIIEYIKNMDFMNTRGEVEWSLTTDEEDYGTYQEVATEVFDSLDIEEGKAVALYVANNNPYNIITSMQKPVTVHEIDLINTYNIGLLNIELEKEILQKYLFYNGKVTFDMLSQSFDFNQGTIIAEANRTGERVIVNDLRVSTDVISIACEYFENSKPDNQPVFTIMISKWYGNEVIKSEGKEDNLNDYDSVMIGDSEVLYQNLNDIKTIEWISEECYVRISSVQVTMTKEELLKIAEQIKLK